MIGCTFLTFKMKFSLCAVLLCIIKSSFVQTSPISETDVPENVNLSKNEGLEKKNVSTGVYYGYVPTPGIGTHKYHGAQKKSWNDARNTCLNERGHLAVINSAAEEALLAKYINITGGFGIDQIWIGVRELFKKDEWVSVKDEPLDVIGYAHWANGQPDSSPNEHCLTLTHDGVNGYGLNDFVGERELFFVCEM